MMIVDLSCDVLNSKKRVFKITIDSVYTRNPNVVLIIGKILPSKNKHKKIFSDTGHLPCCTACRNVGSSWIWFLGD